MTDRNALLENPLPFINNVIGQVDDIKVNAMERLRTYQHEKLQQLYAEIERLQRKHGKDHERVERIMSQGRLWENSYKATTIQLELFKMQSDVLDDTSWRIQGFVHDKKGEPVSNARVELIVAESKVHKEVKKSAAREIKETDTVVASGHTNGQGFYVITLTKELRSIVGQNLSVKIIDKKGKLTFRSETFLTPKAGLIDVVNVSV